MEERHTEAVRIACRAIESTAAEAAPDLAELAATAGLSRFHFLRVFRKVTGVTPRQYAEKHRAERVRAELRAGGSVTRALYGAGFNSGSRFYEKAPQMLGMTPGQFRAGGAGVPIRYAVANSALGPAIVAATDRGICSVRFGDSESALIEELRSDFPRAEIMPTDSAFDEWVRGVVACIDDPKAAHDLPLDIRGTAFQQRVWQALREIPAGATRTYAELAAQAGSPKAVRAVGSACGANGVAVLVPCHRAVRADGGLGGYRWGVERKRRLLDREAD